MHWTIAAPFFKGKDAADSRWIDDFVEGGHSFYKVPRRDRSHSNWHNRASRNTQLDEWLSFWQQSQEAQRTASSGVITVFPQLALMSAIHKHISLQKTPLLAWCFNVGACYPGLKQLGARVALKCVDRFVVHSRRECETVSQWLKLPQERFEFVPLQRAAIPIVASEAVENPFILSMGSANRDYQTLFQAVEKLGIRTIVVAGQHALQGLRIPACVEVLSGLTQDACRRLAQQARINVVPLLDSSTAAGQVTIVEAMCMARPVIATDCIGSEDYIRHGQTGLLVQPYAVEQLTNAIAQLWSDETLRQHLGQAAVSYTETHCSDQAAGKALRQILNQLEWQSRSLLVSVR